MSVGFPTAGTWSSSQRRTDNEFETDRHSRLLGREYVEHDHRESNHQGLDNQLLHRPPPSVRPDADVRRHKRPGGLLSFYDREAA